MISKSVLLLALVSISFVRPLEIQRVYTTEDGLPGDEVRVLYADHQNQLWAGSNNGPSRWSEDRWQPGPSEQPLQQGVSTIFEDSKGNLWFGSFMSAHRFDGERYTTFSIKEDLGLAGRVPFAFFEDNQHRIWAATPSGASVFDGESWTPFAEGLKHPVVHDISQDRHGALWFATRKGGLNIYNGDEWKYLFPDKNCRKLLRDANSNMWVGTSDGLLHYDGSHWVVYREGTTVLPMFEGPKGFIWCISNGTDILRVSKDGRTIHYQDPAQSSVGEIYDLALRTENGDVLAATDKGILVLH